MPQLIDKKNKIIIYFLLLFILSTTSVKFLEIQNIYSSKVNKVNVKGLLNVDNLKILDEIKFKDKVVGKVLIDGVYSFALIKLFDPNFSEFYKEQLKVDQTELRILIPPHFKI